MSKAVEHLKRNISYVDECVDSCRDCLNEFNIRAAEMRAKIQDLKQEKAQLELAVSILEKSKENV